MELQDARKEPGKRFSCDECTFDTKYKGSLERHMKAIHEQIILKNQAERIHKGIADFACDQCSHKTNSKGKLITHVKVVHEKIKNSSCNHCSYAAYSTYDVKKHIKIVHEKIQDLACDFCSYRTGVKSNLKGHMKKRHSGNAKNNVEKCQLCQFTAATAESLTEHLIAMHVRMN